MADLRPEPHAVTWVRRQAAQVLGRWQVGATADWVVLLLDELVTNVVMHARSPFTVTLARAQGWVRVGVQDVSSLPARLTRSRTDQVNPRGLRMVDRIADRWGVTPSRGGGKTVWFELAITDDDR